MWAGRHRSVSSHSFGGPVHVPQALRLFLCSPLPSAALREPVLAAFPTAPGPRALSSGRGQSCLSWEVPELLLGLVCSENMKVRESVPVLGECVVQVSTPHLKRAERGQLCGWAPSVPFQSSGAMLILSFGLSGLPSIFTMLQAKTNT